MLVPALRRLGYDEQADRIVASLADVVERHGFREYYNPLDGEGLAARHFGWSTLLVDLLPTTTGAPAPPLPPGRRHTEPGLIEEAWAAGREAASSLIGNGRRRLRGAADVETRRRARR